MQALSRIYTKQEIEKLEDAVKIGFGIVDTLKNQHPDDKVVQLQHKLILEAFNLIPYDII
jgi:hypothetical protein